MKKIIIITVFVIMFSFITSILLAQNFVYTVFNIPAETPRENYLPGGADDYLVNCDYFQRSWDPVGPTGGWLDYQFRSPDIATPPVAGPEGGNALYGNSNSPTDTREGYWIQLNPAVTDQSFTVEVFFRLEVLEPAYAEYKMQNIVSTFWMSDNKGMEIRYMGTFGNFIQLMTNDGATEHNTGTGAISAGTWYYAAAVYDHSLSQISLYFADASTPGSITPVLIGTVNPNWPTFTMQWLCLGAWPNPAGSCRDITGYIDASSVAYSALSPSEFYLLYGPPYIAHTKTNWQIYE